MIFLKFFVIFLEMERLISRKEETKWIDQMVYWKNIMKMYCVS